MSMNYEEWARLVPEALTQDTLWKVEAYRLAVFLADIGWNDVTRLLADKEPWGCPISSTGHWLNQCELGGRLLARYEPGSGALL
jgi:hypothetical protein